jgi:hypothetical protein
MRRRPAADHHRRGWRRSTRRPLRRSCRSALQLHRRCCLRRSPMLPRPARCGCRAGGSRAGSTLRPPAPPAGAGRETAGKGCGSNADRQRQLQVLRSGPCWRCVCAPTTCLLLLLLSTREPPHLEARHPVGHRQAHEWGRRPQAAAPDASAAWRRRRCSRAVAGCCPDVVHLQAVLRGCATAVITPQRLAAALPPRRSTAATPAAAIAAATLGPSKACDEAPIIQLHAHAGRGAARRGSG